MTTRESSSSSPVESTMDNTTTTTTTVSKPQSLTKTKKQLNGNESNGGGGDVDKEEEECDVEVWDSLSKNFKQVQTLLDQNRILIQQVNENHKSKIPDNLASNVGLIREINGNISKVLSIYSDLSVNFSNIVHQWKRVKNDNVESTVDRASHELEMIDAGLLSYIIYPQRHKVMIFRTLRQRCHLREALAVIGEVDGGVGEDNGDCGKAKLEALKCGDVFKLWWLEATVMIVTMENEANGRNMCRCKEQDGNEVFNGAGYGGVV